METKETKEKPAKMKYNIGDLVVDEDGNTGIVCIKWNDGDLCALENDAAHPNPKVVGQWQTTDRFKGIIK